MKRDVSRVRVLVLATGLFGDGGGIAAFNRELVAGLAATGRCRLRLVTFSSGEQPPPRDLHATLIPPGGRVRFIGAAARAAGQRPHLVVSGHVSLGGPAAALARAAGSRLWTITHGIEAWHPLGPAATWGLRRSHLVTCVSEYTRKRLLSWSRLRRSRVEVLPDTLDMGRFSPGPHPQSLAERLGVTQRKVLLTVGRLNATERYKGHDRVIPLLRDLEARVGPIHYLVAGDGEDRPRLEALARTHGVADRVTFLGAVDGETLLDLYRLADLFVMPSTGEGFGIVFLEAMATGCPVLGGNRDGSADALGGGELGILVDPLDPRSLRDGILAGLARGRLRDRPIPGVERFSVPRFRERVRELLERVLTGPDPGATDP